MTGKVRLVDVTLTFNTQVFFTNLLVAGGRKPKKKFLRALATEKRIFCADRGLNICYKAQLKPQMVLGDLDSVSTPAITWAEKNKVLVEKLNPNKDDTDFKILQNVFTNFGKHKHDVATSNNNKLIRLSTQNAIEDVDDFYNHRGDYQEDGTMSIVEAVAVAYIEKAFKLALISLPQAADVDVFRT